MNEDIKTLKIGTRGSPLALTQTDMVKAALAEYFPDMQSQVVVIKTSGDWSPSDGEVPLSEQHRGKAQFAKEIEEALLSGQIDVAVHSMKDMDSHVPGGLALDVMLPRADARDAFILNDRIKNIAEISQLKSIETLEDLKVFVTALPSDVRIGTASVRRAAFLRSLRPGLHVETLRGNVQTRIDKLRAGQVDVTLLAMAGLTRLNMADQADLAVSKAVMIPAAGQGAVGIEYRAAEADKADLLKHISCMNTVLCVKAERAALRALGGSCRSPIGAHAEISDVIKLKVVVMSLDGTWSITDEISGPARTVEEAEAIGQAIGERMRHQIPSGIL